MLDPELISPAIDRLANEERVRLDALPAEPHQDSTNNFLPSIREVSAVYDSPWFT